MIGDLPLKEKRKARKAIESFVAETTENTCVMIQPLARLV